MHGNAPSQAILQRPVNHPSADAERSPPAAAKEAKRRARRKQAKRACGGRLQGVVGRTHLDRAEFPSMQAVRALEHIPLEPGYCDGNALAICGQAQDIRYPPPSHQGVLTARAVVPRRKESLMLRTVIVQPPDSCGS